MREIKFRAWDTKNRKWLSELDTGWNFTITEKGEVHRPILDNGLTMHRLEGVVLMQYIGLKDKNGNEIYEGDVIRQSYGNLVVEYDESSASFVFTVDPNDIDAKSFRMSPGRKERKAEIEGQGVIGNIYETPELLPTMSNPDQAQKT